MRLVSPPRVIEKADVVKRTEPSATRNEATVTSSNDFYSKKKKKKKEKEKRKKTFFCVLTDEIQLPIQPRLLIEHIVTMSKYGHGRPDTRGTYRNCDKYLSC